jgi:hypothetical protein
MKTVKWGVGWACNILGGIAALVFFRAPFTDTGCLLMGGRIVVGIICAAGYMLLGPDEEPLENEHQD